MCEDDGMHCADTNQVWRSLALSPKSVVTSCRSPFRVSGRANITFTAQHSTAAASSSRLTCPSQPSYCAVEHVTQAGALIAHDGSQHAAISPSWETQPGRAMACHGRAHVTANPPSPSFHMHGLVSWRNGECLVALQMCAVDTYATCVVALDAARPASPSPRHP